jgi:hypothetical protein
MRRANERMEQFHSFILYDVCDESAYFDEALARAKPDLCAP